MKIVAHVLDGSYGKLAVGVNARISRSTSGGWITVAEAQTSADGCIESQSSWYLEDGLYRIEFDCDSYFAGFGILSAYPEVIVTFRAQGESYALQVQVAIAPYSYSTYFGTLNSCPDKH